MKIITVILFLLPITESSRYNSLDPEYDKTESQITAISKVFYMFSTGMYKQSLRELKFKYETFEKRPIITGSSVIEFTKFIFNEDILSTQDYWDLTCMFGNTLEIGYPIHDIFVEGNVQFLNFENFSSCQVYFSFDFPALFFLYRDFSSVRYSRDPFIWPFTGNKASIVKFNDKELCKTRDKIEDETQVENIVRQEVEKKMKETKDTVFNPIIDTCMHPEDEIFNEKRGNYYILLEPDCNMAAFPWLTNINRFIIRGLNNFTRSKKDFGHLGEKNQLTFKTVDVNWYITSMIEKIHHIKVYDLIIYEKTNHPENLMDNIQVEFRIAAEASGGYTKLLNSEVQQNLEKLIINGIKEAYTKTLGSTKSFTDTINNILRPFDIQTLRNSFVDHEIVNQENTLSDLILFSKLVTEEFHFENITCFAENLNFITLRYKTITGLFSYFLPVEKTGIRIPVNVSIKEATFHISLQQRYPDRTNEIEVQIEDSKNTDITIMITSKNDRISRAERISIGESVLTEFIRRIEYKIRNAAKSTFSPMYGICKHSWNRSAESGSNHLKNEHQYCAIIYDYWMDSVDSLTTQKVKVTMNGWWNFKFINVYHEGKNVIVDGLRIENVTGNITMVQIDDSNGTETEILNYTMDYFLLIINHTDRNVQIQFPVQSNYSIISATPSNISISAEMIEKFYSTVTSYIEQSIYNNHAKFRTILENIMTSVEETPSSEYDASLALTTWLTKLLKEMGPSYKTADPYGDKAELSLGGQEISVVIKSTAPLNLEVIFVPSNHSKKPESEYSIIQQQIRGEILIYKEDRISAKIFFKSQNCEWNILGACDLDKLRFDINCENIQTQSSHNDTHVELKGDFKQIVISFLKTYDNFLRFPDFNFKTSLSSKPFYLIKRDVEYSSDHVLVYHIKLHGLPNFESIHKNVSLLHTQTDTFKITIINLTAHIKWMQSIGGLLSRIPKEMKVKIDKIVLAGDIISAGYLPKIIFTNSSQVQFSDLGNPRPVEKLRETLAPIILDSLQWSIIERFYEL